MWFMLDPCQFSVGQTAQSVSDRRERTARSVLKGQSVLFYHYCSEHNLFHHGETTYRVGWLSEYATLMLKKKDVWSNCHPPPSSSWRPPSFCSCALKFNICIVWHANRRSSFWQLNCCKFLLSNTELSRGFPKLKCFSNPTLWGITSVVRFC